VSGGERGDEVREPEIVVGIDGSADAERALRWGVDEARRRDARVRAVPPTRATSAPWPGSPVSTRWSTYRSATSRPDVKNRK
jgi:nucleotide-binding universal stress UspA family protein